MSVGRAVAAVVAHDGRLDQAGAVAVGTNGQHEHAMTRVLVREPDRAGAGIRSGSRSLPHRMSHNSVTDERAQFGLGHSLTSTRSTMPTIAASTGAPFRPSASPAARPSMTIRTFS